MVGNCLKKGAAAWTVHRFKGDVSEKSVVVFLRGLIPQCTL